MLSCREVAKLADTLIDGELTSMQALQMRLHLAMCKGCSRFVGQMQTTQDLIEAAGAAEVPPNGGQDGAISAIFAQLHEDQKTGG